MTADEPNDDRTRSFVALNTGTLVLHYQIIEKIGEGGMGEVYLALDTKLNRKVALKFLPHHLCQDEDCRKRFKREAQAAAGLDHPNIAAIYEVGEFQGRPFHAMQVVEGQSLKDVIAGKDLPIERLLEISIQVCEGLQAAHNKGIIHRDIKPSNILLDSHGRVRIVDFGLAAIRGGEELTKTGSTLGTIGYMSPEQVQGREIDHRSDLFSLGVVLYELIANQNPFKRDNEAATLKAVSDDEPHPVARYRKDVPDGVQGIIDKALEKDVKTRYQTAAGMLSDLMRVKRSLESGQSAVTAPAISRSASRPVMAIAGFIAIVVVIALFVTKPWQTAKTSEESDKIMLAVLPFENLGDPDDEYFADGITREISSRLASVRSLGVIAHTSAAKYKNSNKPLSQIADELGVSYILDGSIQWDELGDTNIVRVAPQLIRISDETQLWANNYERRITGIFAVQSNIASEISNALGIALSEDERELMHAVPTNSLEAYNAFLKARELYWIPDVDKSKMARIVGLLERAIALDSTFVSAYALLSMAHSGFYHYGIDHSDDRLVLSLEAAQNALDMDPTSPEGHLAMAWYHYRAHRNYSAALTELAAAEAAGIDEYYSIRLVATIHKRRGDFEAAIQDNQRALKYNPRDPDVLHEMSVSYKWLSRHQEAIDLCKRMIELAPDQHMGYLYAAEYYYSIEDGLSSARKILEKMPGELSEIDYTYWIFQEFYERDTTALFRRLDSVEWDAIFTRGEPFTKELFVGWAHQYLGDPSKARFYFEEARENLKSRRSESPDDGLLFISLSSASAGLGLLEESIAYSDSSILAFPVEKDLLDGILTLNYRVRVYVATGQYDEAIDLIERILGGPSPWTIKDYLLDPRIDPLRDHPRFKALIAKYEKEHGTI